MTSKVTAAMDLYSASAKLLDTIVCFFDFQLMRERLPKENTNPSQDFLLSTLLAQSLSECATSFNFEFEAKNIPCPKELLKYLRILYPASRCAYDGLSMN